MVHFIGKSLGSAQLIQPTDPGKGCKIITKEVSFHFLTWWLPCLLEDQEVGQIPNWLQFLSCPSAQLRSQQKYCLLVISILMSLFLLHQTKSGQKNHQVRSSFININSTSQWKASVFSLNRHQFHPFHQLPSVPSVPSSIFLGDTKTYWC